MPIIRRATIDDVEEIVALMHEAYAPIRKLGINFASAYPTVEKVRNNIFQNLCFVYESDQKLISTLSLRMPWSNNPGPYYFPHIWWLATHPDYKGLGIGAKMLQYIETEIVQNDLHSPAVTLGTADNHPWLMKMYERKGYKKFGSRNLGKGHVTQYFIKVLQPYLFKGTAELQQQFTNVTYEEDTQHGI
ncbi:GNAT family N-acetyltransferase [Staphylococcus shinii]|uniref:GNAT family N-acetyltransferase n=1 Tax=Staphylococcus shinii TaxID=2912228 RepID=UPI00298EF518|nr:GNAT family N-acetyltransferase [Staphylococcus shinii]MDW8569948.1 GNAT family N-acetyltransferase [Staphylococcus shinii]MDW8574149.1 GNAT family N-acetyltransferase [Staphylococcus shinii]